MSGTRLNVGRPRPTTLSDPMCEFTPEGLRQILDTPDERFEWYHYQCVLGPFLPAGTYDESVYFLPGAFDHLVTHEEEAPDLVTSVVWFASEYVEQLRADGLLEAVRRELRDSLGHWSRSFRVVHYDRDACRQAGWRQEHADSVANSALIAQATCDLVRFKRHADLAEQFVQSLARNHGDPVKAAWFLEYARSCHSVVRHPPKHAPITKLIADRELLEQNAAVVVEKLVDAEPSPTYWNDTFAALYL